MKHRKSGKCKCHRCASIAAGATPAQADEQQREWTETQIRKHGWIVHFIAEGAETPTGFDAHTHGLQQNYNHPDFQIVIPLPQKVLHTLMITLADRVKAGERFQAGQKVTEVIEGAGGLVKLIDATEGGRPVLRVILPDPNGKLDLGEINDPYAQQYDGVRVEL